MKYRTTHGQSKSLSLRNAVLRGLGEHGSLFMPEEIPELRKSVLSSLSTLSLPHLAFEVLTPYAKEEFSNGEFQDIVEKVFSFEAPVIHIEENIHLTELFHGPTYAFKDFGARFMARVMEKFIQDGDNSVTVLVATSGDTGSAVAQGFFGVEGIDVVLLYPKGKVSTLQEQQLTTVGGNITALAVEGTFDDCQSFVKQAFLDQDITTVRPLSSANSINIARLLPQMIYYFSSVGELEKKKPITFSVPSGNFGNLTAGVFAKRMGLPIEHFVASTNINDSVPRYLQGEEFKPKPTKHTISNAMDVGHPNNFERLRALFGDSREQMCSHISGFSITDDETRKTMKEVYDKTSYILDPHAAVGFLGLTRHVTKYPNHLGVVLGTAHPAKFKDVVDETLEEEIELPEGLAECLTKEKQAIQIPAQYEALKSFLREGR